jgi:hypothetical protein
MQTRNRSVWGALLRAAALGVLSLATAALAASNVVQYVRDAAGNIIEIKRQVAGGVAITSFDPTSGPVGSNVTIYGAGFSAVAADNLVKINGVVASVAAAAVGSLITTVPVGATTGRITVTVGGNTATSSQDFTVVAAGVPIVSSFSPTVGSSGTSVAVSGSNFVIGATTVKLNGVSATATVSSESNLTFAVPGSAGSGRISATTQSGTGVSSGDFIVPPPGIAAADIATTLRLNDGAAPVSFSISAQNKHALLLFEGTQDGYYTLQFSAFSSSPTSAFIDYKIYKPDNTLLTSGRVGNTNRPTIHVPKLPATGSYVAQISPASATLTSNVQYWTDPLVPIDGSPVAIALNAVGQTMRMRFDASAGQRLGLGVMSMTVAPSSSSASTFNVYHPSGTLLNNGAICSPGGGTNPQGNCDAEFTTTQAGIHTIVADIPSNLQASFSAQLSTPVSASLVVGTPQSSSLTRVGQDGRHVLPLLVNDSVAVELLGISAAPQNHSYNLRIYKPDGSLFGSAASSTVSLAGLANLPVAPTAGDYVVEVDPNFGAYGSYTVVAKAGSQLDTTSAAAGFNTSTAGESARFRFSATAGQNVTVGIDTLAHIPASSSASSLTLFKPDGSQLATQSCYTSNPGGRCKIGAANLPVTGVYAVVVTPPAGARVTGNITLSEDQTASLTAGQEADVAVNRTGQSVRYSFSGTAGDYLGIDLVNVSTTPIGQTVTLTAYKPDGSLFFGIGSYPATTRNYLILPALPTTGTYKVVADAAYGATWQGRIALRAAATMAIDGAARALATTYQGQVARLTFSATSGQRLEFGGSGLSYAASNSGSTDITLFRPDGTVNGSMNCYTLYTGCDFTVTSLPVTGIYSLTIAPPPTATISGGTLSLSTPLAGTFLIGDPAQTIAINRPGQTARYSFSGTAGQLLRLNWSGAVTSGGATVNVSVLKPDGSALSSGSYANGSSSGFDIASLPSSGTYTVVIDPLFAATTSASFALITR